MALKDNVAAVFNDPAVARINFWLGGLQISTARLRAVGGEIRERRIKVKVTSTGNLLSAAYDPHLNTIALGSASMTTSVMGRAAIVHEGVHALVDFFRCRQTTELTDEAAGYLTEVIFLRRKHTGVRGGGAIMAVYQEARRLVQVHKLANRANVRLRWADYVPLRRAVHNVLAYSGLGWMQLTSGHGVP